MPSLSDHHSKDLVKLLYIGNSGTGKTGSLVSLVEAGYKLKIYDFDNGLDILVSYIKEQCPDKLGNVSYRSFRDKYSAGPAGPVVTRPKAFVEALKAFQKWPDDESDPAAWGSDTIIVIDSLTAMSKAAFNWARGMQPDSKDPRQWYFAAQQAVENVVDQLTDPNTNTNVIFISHVHYVEHDDGTTKGYASSVGSALGPKLAKYFNNCLLVETKGSGEKIRRVIRTVPTITVDLKTSAPFKVSADFGIESGLSELFKILKGT